MRLRLIRAQLAWAGGPCHILARSRVIVTVLTLRQQRYILNGFANGILILSICALIWLTGAIYCAVCAQAGLDPLGDASRVDFPPVWLTLNLVFTAALIAGSIRVRWLSRRFKESQPSSPTAAEQQYGRRVRQKFFQIVLAEWTGVGAAVLLGIVFHRRDLIWPGASFVICLHFAPLGSLFRIRQYYFLAAAGCLFCLIALLTPAASMNTAHRLLVVGAGVGVAMWMTAAYSIRTALRFARKTA